MDASTKFYKTNDGSYYFLDGKNKKVLVEPEAAKSLGLFDSGKYVAEPTVPLIGGTSWFFGHLVQGVLWASVAAGLIQLIGNLAGLDKNLVNTLTLSAVGGNLLRKPGILPYYFL